MSSQSLPYRLQLWHLSTRTATIAEPSPHGCTRASGSFILLPTTCLCAPECLAQIPANTWCLVCFLNCVVAEDPRQHARICECSTGGTVTSCTTCMQGLVKMTGAWLRRLHAMTCTQARRSDPLRIVLRGDKPQCSRPRLPVTLALSLPELLLHNPTAVEGIGQYAGAHGEHVAASGSCAVDAERSPYRVSAEMQVAMKVACLQCLVCSRVIVWIRLLTFHACMRGPHGAWRRWVCGIRAQIVQIVQRAGWRR